MQNRGNRWTLGALGSVAVVAISACGGSPDVGTFFGTFDGSSAGLGAAREAASEWNRACGRDDLVTVVAAGGVAISGAVPIVEVASVEDGAVGRTFIHDHAPAWIHVLTAERIATLSDRGWGYADAMGAQRSVIAHEIGHALGRGHDGIGIMVEGADPSKHVVAANCPGAAPPGATAVHGGSAP